MCYNFIPSERMEVTQLTKKILYQSFVANGHGGRPRLGEGGPKKLKHHRILEQVRAHERP